jgi:pilus assembly protein CpaF
MSLSDRLATARDRGVLQAHVEHQADPQALPHYERVEGAGPQLVVTDALAAVKARAVEELFKRLGSRINDPSLTSRTSSCC